MRRAVLIPALAAVLVLSSGCGKKGPLLPPIIRTPQKVDKFTLTQRGSAVWVGWTNPTASVDGTPLSGVEEAEVWVMEQDKPAAGTEAPKINASEVEDKARLAVSLNKAGLLELVETPGAEPPSFLYPYSVPKESVGKKILFFSVRVKDPKGRESAFVDPLKIEPQVVPLPPKLQDLLVEEGRIGLTWTAPESNIDGSQPAKASGYLVFRADGKAPTRLLTPQPIKELRYDDTSFEFGVTSRYFVRACAAEAAPFLESSDSETHTVTPLDTFPPAPPSGLKPVAGRDFIALSWEGNREKDLAGYKVWRKEEGQEAYVLLTPQPILENAFTDSRVEKKVRYHYAISACDIRGNESARREVVAESLRDGPR